MFTNEIQEKEIIMYFSWIEAMVKNNNDFAYTDLNISLETFILRLLKIVHLGNYENCNIKKINYPYIDLIDEHKKIGIQITSECTANKIKETLKNKQGYKIKFFLLNSNYKPRKNTFIDYSNFSVSNDIFNFKTIIYELKKINSTNIYNNVIDFLEDNIVIPVSMQKIEKEMAGYSEYQQRIILSDIKKTCENFVPTKITQKCLKHLQDKNLLILIGNPGVGKSYNSKFLVAKYLEKGYKLLYSPNKSLKDIFEIYNDKDKFVLFIDDIYGSNSNEFMATLSEEEIVSIYENSNENLKIIINSRTSIFNDVNEKYDKIGRLGLKPFIIETSEFTYIEKARILIKHLKNSKLSSTIIYELFKNGKYYTFEIESYKNIYAIIYHRNYNPRLIELITSEKFSFHENYIDKVMENLDNPNQIYDHAFNNNLNDDERKILKVICSKSLYKYNYEVNLDNLEKFIVDNFNIDEDQFKLGLQKLEKSFISIYKNRNNYVCKFYDPSVRDYCINKFNNSKAMQYILEKTDDINDLDNLLLNDKIDWQCKKNKIIELDYDNFQVFEKLKLKIIRDIQLKEYVKNKIFSNLEEITYYKDQFCIPEIFSKEELLAEIEKMLKIENCVSYSVYGANRNITKFIIHNYNFFSDCQQLKIIKSFINEINTLIDSEIMSFIDSQQNKEECDDAILEEEYDRTKKEIMESLNEDGFSITELQMIDSGLDVFTNGTYDDYVQDVFDNKEDDSISNVESKEVKNIVEEYYESIN